MATSARLNQNYRPRLRFLKPCRRCGKEFRPSGRFCKLCDKCNINTVRDKEKHDKLRKIGKMETVQFKHFPPNSNKQNRPRLRRPCKRCGNMFMPTGRDSRICVKCWKPKGTPCLKSKSRKSRYGKTKNSL